MPRRTAFEYHSRLATLIERFIAEKRACGYKFDVAAESLWRLDRFLCAHALAEPVLPKALVEQWIAKDPNESLRTHHMRIGLMRRFAGFLNRHGCAAYVPVQGLESRRNPGFVPRILTNDEMQRLFVAADAIPARAVSPQRHRVMPEMIRLLYGCGLRVSEVIHLRFRHVDLVSGILTIQQSKFRKDRLVPMTAAVTERLRRYASLVSDQSDNAYFFPSPRSGSYHRHTIYHMFRQLLWKCGISHGGRGRGPRLHDLRHTFAVHRLLAWYKEGVDLHAKLPVLTTYMGHHSITDTQMYLQLTAELFPYLTNRVEESFGHVIPRRMQP